MSDTYQLTLTDSELREIILKADESRMKSSGRADMVRWALVNAIYHLDAKQMHELGEAIANRSGGTYIANSDVKCVGSGTTDGCGYCGGRSGYACPECGGMLLSSRAISDAASIAEEWIKHDSVNVKQEIQ